MRACCPLLLVLLLLLQPTAADWHPWGPEVAPVVDAVVALRRNNVFYVGDELTLNLTGHQGARTLSTHFEVLNYSGSVVASGSVAPTPAPANGGSAMVPTKLVLPTLPPGWYKLTLTGAASRSTLAEPWIGTVTGGTTFVVFRADQHFPQSPLATAPNMSTADYGGDEVARGVTGMGPGRHEAAAFLPRPNNTFTEPWVFDQEGLQRTLDNDLRLDSEFYLAPALQDAERPRSLLISFGQGIPSTNVTPPDWPGFEKLVARYKDVVTHWEARNEPQTGSETDGAAFAAGEFQQFHDHVKAAAGPSAQVTGPGAVCINPFQDAWYDGFFSGGGAKLIDAFSFHAYNAVNGDLSLGRQNLDGLERLLVKHGVDKKPRWQTEQGAIAPFYGSYHPRLQGRWIMLEKMLFEQYGIPKEQDNLWYAKSHGFWDFPAWWVNDDGGFNPAAPLMRVWSEELWVRFEF